VRRSRRQAGDLNQDTSRDGTRSGSGRCTECALADLRRARHDVVVKGFTGDAQHPHDKACVGHIDDAINDIKQAGVDDGKPMGDKIPGDPTDRKGASTGPRAISITR
jgi:hypothetical protein